MKDIIFKGKIQFGIWKFLENVEGVVKPQYGCAQPIENGVHLGNGNNTIEEVGSCEINPPVISCAGALSIINFPFIQGDWKFFLDDFTTEVIEGGANDFTYYLNTQMSGKLTGDFDGFFWVENLDNQPHRIKMIPVAGEIPPTHPLPPLDNPTFMVYEDGSLTFCLAAIADND